MALTCPTCGVSTAGACACCPRVIRGHASIDDRFDEFDLEGGFGGAGHLDLELDRAVPVEDEAAATAARKARSEARDRAAAAEVSGFGVPARGPFGDLVYAVHVIFRRRALVRERTTTDQEIAGGHRDVAANLAFFARALVGEAHRAELSGLVDEVGAVYAIVLRGKASGRLPASLTQEILRVREAVRTRMKRARDSIEPMAPPDDGRLSFPPELLGRAGPTSVAPSWLDDASVLSQRPASGDPVTDLAASLGRIAQKAKTAGLGTVSEAAERTARTAKRLAVLERRGRLQELAPATVDQAAFDRGWRLVASALGLVAAMVAAIGLLLLVNQFRG